MLSSFNIDNLISSFSTRDTFSIHNEFNGMQTFLLENWKDGKLIANEWHSFLLCESGSIWVDEISALLHQKIHSWAYSSSNKHFQLSFDTGRMTTFNGTSLVLHIRKNMQFYWIFCHKTCWKVVFLFSKKVCPIKLYWLFSTEY